MIENDELFPKQIDLVKRFLDGFLKTKRNMKWYYRCYDRLNKLVDEFQSIFINIDELESILEYIPSMVKRLKEDKKIIDKILDMFDDDTLGEEIRQFSEEIKNGR